MGIVPEHLNVVNMNRYLVKGRFEVEVMVNKRSLVPN